MEIPSGYKNKAWLSEQLELKTLTQIGKEQGVARNTIKKQADEFKLSYGGRGRKAKYTTALEKKVADKNKTVKYLGKLKQKGVVQFKVKLTDMEADKLRLLKNKYKTEKYQELFMILLKKMNDYLLINKRPVMPFVPDKTADDYKLYYLKDSTINKINKIKSKIGLDTGEFFTLLLHIFG